MFSFITDLLTSYRYFFEWRDGVEIILLATVIYYFSLWLQQDRQKNLLGYFYAYCLVGFVSYQAQLSSLCFLLAITCPIVLMLFITFHQTTLQKNFVALRALAPVRQETNDWLAELIRCCLVALNNNKHVRCIIECGDSLSEMVYCPLELQTPIAYDVLTLLINSNTYNQELMLWTTRNGTLAGLNSSWTGLNHQPGTNADHDTWYQNTLFMTSKVDVLVFEVSPTTRSFTIMVNGQEFSNISPGNAITFIKKYLQKPTTVPGYKGEQAHEKSSKRSQTQHHA